MLENESVIRDLTATPPMCLQILTNMQLNCLCPQLLKNGCACSGHFRFRSQMNSGPLNPVVQSCLKECPLLGELLCEPPFKPMQVSINLICSYSKSIIDFCNIDSAELEFPEFRARYGRMHRKAFTSSLLPCPTHPSANTLHRNNFGIALELLSILAHSTRGK
jgi:hypothetical protein